MDNLRDTYRIQENPIPQGWNREFLGVSQPSVLIDYNPKKSLDLNMNIGKLPNVGESKGTGPARGFGPVENSIIYELM